MVDTTSPLLELLLQATGGNNNSWGVNLNDSVFIPLENAIAGVASIGGMTGGAVDLDDEDFDGAHLYATIILGGTLSEDLIITAPSTAKKWTFINNTTGNFYTLIKTSAGTAVNIPKGVVLDITCDGLNMYRADRDRVGEYFYHAGTTVPPGALECNGATPFRASLVDLYGEIGTTHGPGNGTTTFTLPDAYTAGKFLRSRTASVTAGTAQTNQNKSHTHTGSGTTGNISADHTHTYSGSTGTQSAAHSHAGVAVSSNGSSTGGGAFPVVGSLIFGATGTESASHSHAYSGTTSGVSSNHTHTYSFTTSTGSADGTEARPENISAILCIRY